jgi:hypothetical protein
MHNRIWGYLSFYRSFAAVSLITTVVSIVYYIIIDDAIRSIISIKLITVAAIYFFTTTVRADKLIFYYNLSYRPVWLWSFSYGIDTLIFIVSLVLTSLFL